MSALSWYQAREVAWSAISGLPAARVELAAAVGRVLTDPVLALVDLPPADTSAMDGFAVAGPGPWQLIQPPAGPTGTARAGTTGTSTAIAPLPLRRGQALDVATGGAVPAGTEAVVAVERTVTHPGGELTADPPRDGLNLRRAGEEARAGTVLIEAGTELTPVLIGLAAAAGHDSLPVRPRATVRLLITGDELLTGGLPQPGRARDALGPLLPGLVHSLGGSASPITLLADDPGILLRAISEVRSDGAGTGLDYRDIVVTTGSTSVGRRDHLRAVLSQLNARVLVDGVACRPGHPQLLAVLPDGTPLVGLPGNPLAAVVAALTLLDPLLQAAQGIPLGDLPRVRLSAEATAAPHATRLLPVRLIGPEATPLAGHGPAMLRGLAGADALAVIPASDHHLPAGSEVTVLTLPWAHRCGAAPGR